MARMRQFSVTTISVSPTYSSTVTISAAATSLDLTNTTSFGGGSIRFGSSMSLIYDAANSLGLRNGVNAQTFAIYNTFTAGTPDYERLELSWASNIATISAQKNGTGTARVLRLYYGGTSSHAIQIPIAVASGVILGSGVALAATGSRVIIGNTANISATSGTVNALLFNDTLLDSGTNSTTVVPYISVAPAVNYTGASRTGKVYLAYFNPTLTSQPSGNNAGIAFSSTLASSTFPATRWYNQTDEDTNYEDVRAGFAVGTSNVWTIGSFKGGSGTLRGIQFGVSGNSIGFYGVTPAARTSAYTLTASQAPSRTLAASASATATNCNNVLSQVIQDLQGMGLLA